MDKVDCVVIGAGVIGLACARALACAGREVLILERETTFGSVTSARNSEVIHAGIYYPCDSLKAQLCIRGKAMLYQYAAERNIAHRQCGKIVVATDKTQIETLIKIRQQAESNGVFDARMLNVSEVAELEPSLSCVGALYSPSTGVVDSHALMVSLLADAQHEGALLVCRTEVQKLEPTNQGVVVTTGGLNATSIVADLVVNAAGLDAPDLVRPTLNNTTCVAPNAFYAKGMYFSLRGLAPFSHLVYPVPEPGGLGIHYTIDLNNRARFGPDIKWVSEKNYDVTESSTHEFYESIKRYWPSVRKEDLSPDYAGIRPKISGPNEPAADFVIQSPHEHGVRGLINLFGIESPGLTASMAIADCVVAISNRAT